MKKYLSALLITTAFISLHVTASPVWKISKGKDYLYIGGTIHLLCKEDYPLPSAFEQAYTDSQKVVFEVDLASVKSMEFIQKMMVRNMYAGEDDITKHLKPETVKSLEAFLEKKKMTLEPLKKMKPGFLTIMLATVEMQRMGMIESGVDQFYYDKAVNDKKPVGELETADDQLNFICNMGLGNEDDLILHSIDEMEKIDDMMAEMKQAWRIGELSEMDKIELSDMKKEFPDLYRDLLINRNNNWLPQIKAMFNTQEIELILVGALHLSGEDGLLEKLKNSGYKVQQLK